MFYAALFLIAAITLVILIRRRRAQKEKDKNRLQRPRWKKDVVYLVQFPISPHVRSISPFRCVMLCCIRNQRVPWHRFFNLEISFKFVLTCLIHLICFSIKLETWIRLNKIPYENVHSYIFSKKGQMPYIELNGEQIADSNIIIGKLKVCLVVKSSIQ